MRDSDIPRGARLDAPSSAPFGVWQNRPFGQFLWLFDDEDLAAQFCVNNGLQLIRNPLQF